MKTHALVAAALLAPALALSTAIAQPAQAAPPAHSAQAPRCMGKPATILARKGFVNGTPRADVIVVTGVGTSVYAKGGNDLICVGGRGVSVDGDTGRDVVRVQGGTESTTTLGPGNDTFVGGAGDDTVFSLSAEDSLGKDTIRTRGGDDYVNSGRAGLRNTDVVRLGPGDDTLSLAGDSRSARIDGGGGSDDLGLSSFEGSGAAVIDNVAGQLTMDGTTLASWADFEEFSAVTLTGSLQFVGSDRDESVDLHGGLLSATLGGGDDYLHLTTDEAGQLDGGTGRDELKVRLLSGPDDTVTGSLVTNSVEWQTATPGSLSFSGMEGLHVYALARTTLYGDAGPNVMSVTSCAGTIHGGDGDDTLFNDGIFDIDDDSTCGRTPPSTLYGEGGNDRLDGARSTDTLDGGDGIDVADGRGGRDTCVAETTKRCEA